MIKILATCDEEQNCPLYQRESQLEFAPPIVTGRDGALVCSIAVEAMQKVIPQISAGQSPALYARTFCGGCPEGKAWWNFERLQKETGMRLAPDVSLFILNNISKMKIFSGVPQEKLTRIVKLIKGTRVTAGQDIVARGRSGQAFYIVLEGECEVIQQDEKGMEATLAVLPRGECFGEMSLITGEPASATVRARTAGSVLVISKQNFHAMLALAPEIAITLARILAGRLTITGGKVLDLLKRGLSGRLEHIAPAELIQAMNVNSQTGMLIIQNEGDSATIYLHEGQVHEVTLRDKTGDDAFYEFLSWNKGDFRFEPIRKENSVRTVQMDTVGLLLEGMRRVDEYRHTGAWKAV